MKSTSSPAAAVVLISCAALAGGACTAARTNARVERGLSGGATASGIAFFGGQGQKGQATEATTVPAGEAFAQYAWTAPGGTATALQLKVPLMYPLASLDIYRQFTGDDAWSSGAGVEVGIVPGAYFVITRHDGPRYLSLTGRTYLDAGYVMGGNLFLNPQVAVGWQSRLDVSGYLGYAHAFGAGVDFEVEDHAYKDIRRAWLYGGMGVRF